ncbi:TonB-dependent receptor [Pseudoalteromonas piscicida]|uniref:TonB-dependent receptor n=1 Tax=Pseudoalteromonas piscicida TaxID=43662 RepID=UPI0027383A50|nr:TonB-dependent receptor [Pseudoalteromonas piscicida]MDP4490102.1 TonB-dependent receptor [Pseudoalteromonas piscicida]
MKHTLKLCAVGLAVSCALSQYAHAQETEQNSGSDEQDKAKQQVEKIEVRGVRSSIKESLFLKKNAVGVMDAIVAEDIGKFPDQNLAEALQRMTGIAITRNAGEGQNVTVRGLGGDFNVTTINGRRMASEHTSRDFNFDLIAPEMVQALEVYKSPQAQTQEGGIGSVINIKTRRPLDMDGFTLAGSAKAIYEERTGDTNPQASFLISDTFFDNTFGALFTAVYSERTQREDSYEGQGFYDPEENTDVRVPVDSNRNGELDEGEKVHPSMIPGYVRYSNWQDERERIGASLALQWRPTNDIDVTFDSLYSSYKTDGEKYQISFVTYDEPWTPGIPAVGELKFNEDGNVNYIELVDGAMAELLNVSEPRNTDTWQAGLNFKWYATSNLTLEFDVSKSRAERINDGDNRYIVARGFVDTITIDQTGDNLLPDVTMSPALNADQPFGAHYSYNYGTEVISDVEELRLEGTFIPEWEFVKDIKFGFHYGKQSKARDVSKSNNPSMFSNGGAYFKNSDYDSFDNSSVEKLGGLNLFRLPADVLVPANFDNFLEGEPGMHPAPWASFDYDKLYAFYQSINAQAADEKIRASKSPKDSYELSESTFALYLETNLVGELSEMPYNLNLGVRAIKTEITSDGYVFDYPSLVYNVEEDEDGDIIYRIEGDIADYYSDSYVEDDYTDVLPSMNFKLEITDSLLFRTSAAKVITRPSIDFLTPYSSINFSKFELNLANPGIKPLRADQLDLGLEWYFSDYGALTFATYYKDIKSVIAQGRVGTIKVGKFIKDGVEVDGPEFTQVSPRSEAGAEIKGFEIAYQQSFEELLPAPFDGLGMQINYTFTDSKYDDPEKDELPFAGMSEHSYNAVIYYEKDDYQARIAYNWRDDYLKYPDAWGGPEWAADYGQFDFSASYNLTEKTRIDLNVTNLTNERQWSYIKTQEQVSHLSRYGRSISLGINTSF